MAHSKTAVFDIPEEIYPDGFPVHRRSRPPRLNNKEIVLDYEGSITVEPNYEAGKIIVDRVQISPTICLEKKQTWEFELPKDEVENLLKMTAEEIKEYVNKGDNADILGWDASEAQEDLQKHVKELVEEIVKENLSEELVVKSSTGKYTLQDLARIIYHALKCHDDYKENETIYQLEFYFEFGILSHT